MKNDVKVTLLRHATLIVEIGGVKFLVDPLLAEKNAYEPVANSNNIRYPMIDLPFTKERLLQLINDVDAVLVTHTHRDHWDDVAQAIIDKSKPLFCQPADIEKIKAQGFLNVISIEDKAVFKKVTINRTSGQHGTGEIGIKMGIVSGFVLKHATESVYIAGDTIWCQDVKDALQTYKPEITIVNAGAPQYTTGDPITMTPNDIMEVHREMPTTKIMAVHMDTVNHAKVSRKDLREWLVKENLLKQVLIPEDGHLVQFVKYSTR